MNMNVSNNKIILTKEETENLTKIKHKDIIKMIKNAQHLCDKFHKDEIATFQERIHPLSNPMEEINGLLDVISFTLNKHTEGKWEISSKAEDKTKNDDLYNMLSDIHKALQNAKGHALEHSKFRNDYQKWVEIYNNHRNEKPFHYATKKLEQELKEKAGWVPMYYNNTQLEYQYCTIYNDRYVSLDEVKRFDNKSTTPPISILTEMKNKGKN